MDKFVEETSAKLPSWAKPWCSEPGFFCHKVRYPGETLSIIAEWYTGDLENWRYLAKGNPELDSNLIKIGTQIHIPETLLRTRKRMPKNFVQAVSKRHEARAATAAKDQPRAKPSSLTATYYYHKVRYPGETLSIIAKWYTGTVKNWRALTKANPRLDPNHIVMGDKIRIPNKILHTREAMPRSFITDSATARKAKPPTSSSSAKTTEEKQAQLSKPKPPPDDIEVLELFGPK
jgi:LysM repeat protein